MASSAIITLDLRICTTCKNEPAAYGGYQCKLCATERVRAWYADNKERAKANSFRSRLKTQYSITLEQYTELLVAQDYKCAICGRPEDENPTRLCIDHDHSCCPSSKKSCGKCVRGLLCRMCNTVIGYYQDNPEIAKAMVNYLEGGWRLQQWLP